MYRTAGRMCGSALLALVVSVSVAVPVRAGECPGDCDGDGAVAVSELIQVVNIALGTTPPSACDSPSLTADGVVTVDELVQAVQNDLRGCPPVDCPFRAGALPETTLASDAPRGEQIPIDHIVVLMQENRSFDSYFGRLPEFGVPEVDGLTDQTSNPDSAGDPVFVFHQDRYCTEDTDHSWAASHRQYNDGANDGFVVTNGRRGARAMGYYDESDLPYDYALARTFAVGDRYFCSLLGPTNPNRFYVYSATSFGHIRNQQGIGIFSQRTIFDVLSENGISWKIYFSDIPFAALFAQLSAAPEVVRIDEYFSDAAAGTLPRVAFVDPAFFNLFGPQSDEHPPGNIQRGQALVADVVNALIASPNWPRAAFFLTYDEHGGFHDHVPPPPACVPDDIPPMLRSGDPVARFDRYGFRVPFVAVSPYAKPGYVSHVVYDHTSILRFIETRFSLPALSDRDANADPLLDLFDFDNAALLDPPRLPAAVVDQDKVDMCRADGFPG